jgi:MFS family permease
VLPAVRERAGASEAELGAALLAVGLGALPAMLVTGRLVDRLGPLVAPTLLLLAGTALLPTFARSVPVLALALLAVGAASGALDVAANAAVSALEAETGRRLMQAAHALFSVGVVAGSVSAGLARHAGATPPQVVGAVAGFLVLVAALNRGLPAGRSAEQAAGRLALTPALLLLGGLCAVAFVFESGVESWSALFLEDELDAPPAASGLGPGLFAAAMAVGRGLAHGLGGRVGERGLLVGGALVGGCGVLVAAPAEGAPLALAGFALAGAGIAVAAPVFFGAAGRVGGAARGSAVATVTTISYLGFVAGPVLMGGVAGAAGLRAAWVTLALVALALALAAARATLPLRPRGG